MVEVKEFNCHPCVLYKMDKNIAAGGFGTVKIAYSHETNLKVAIKFIAGDGRAIEKLWLEREVSLLKEMNHENVVSLLEVYRQEEGVYLVFEFMSFTLKQLIYVYEIAKDFKMVFLFQILRGLAYCHACGIIHRDLKPENILFNEETLTMKLADFGLSRKIDTSESLTPKVGSLWYNSPEALYEFPDYSFPVDIWAIGCIFAEMAGHKALFSPTEATEDGQLDAIFSVLGTPNESNWPGICKQQPYISFIPQILPDNLGSYMPELDRVGVDLLSKMLCLDPHQRITAANALEHEYFREVDTEIANMKALPSVLPC